MKRSDFHINCDLGEGSKNEADLMNHIQACNIACGGHYGTSDSIYETLSKAVDLNLEVGAHPYYPDLENFGRVSMDLNKEDFLSTIRSQLDRYFNQLSKFKTENNHIKAHGALYNDLCRDTELVQWFLEALKDYSFKSIYTPFNGSMASQAQLMNLPLSYEAFIDRNYTPEGWLVSRALPKAEKDSLASVYKQLESIVLTKKVECSNGEHIPMIASTFCIHGDHPEALARLKYIEQQLR
jgi:UPF0271 protein